MPLPSKKLRFTVGFNGNNALVDRKLYRRAGRMSAQHLLEDGLLTHACRLAWETNDTPVLRQLADRLQIQCNDDQLPELLAQVFGITAHLGGVSSLVFL